MIASLPMYDRPETAEANDRFWAAIHRGLRDGPAELTRGGDLWEHWLSPDLVMSQTCGYPYRARLHGRVTLVGTPDYGLPGCPPGHYNSALVARRGDPRAHPEDFAQARFAYNEALSQSGWAAPQTHAAARGVQFSNTIATGGHRFSARAVAENSADIAAIDGLTWIMLCRYDDFATSLRVIAFTEPTPALPYITASTRDPAPIFAAIRSAIAALSPADRETLHLRDLVEIPAAAYLAVPNPPPPAGDKAALSG